MVVEGSAKQLVRTKKYNYLIRKTNTHTHTYDHTNIHMKTNKHTHIETNKYIKK